jgi:hypothetical protein
VRAYVQSVLRRFGGDSRVVVWDLFNEPDNDYFYTTEDLPNKREVALVLLRKVFTWAREVNPGQPLTVGAWRESWGDTAKIGAIDRYALEQSDVITFHAYSDSADVAARVNALTRYGRPMLCTEYLARTYGSRIQTVLPLLASLGVGAYNWGLVSGKTQTIYDWSSWSKKQTAEPRIWHHDLLRWDGTPFDSVEIRVIREVATAKAGGRQR